MEVNKLTLTLNNFDAKIALIIWGIEPLKKFREKSKKRKLDIVSEQGK